MASITDITYFQGELNLPDTDKTPGQAYVQLFIDQYEDEYLTTLLGPALKASFLAGLQADPIPQQWTDLKNQIWYTVGTAKLSAVANYIYFYIVRRNTYSNSATGLIQNKNENSIQIDPKIECARAWNQCSKLSFRTYKFLKQNVSTYGDLPYSLRFANEDWIYDWYDWAFWWGWYPFAWRRCIPEIYQKLNALGI